MDRNSLEQEQIALDEQEEGASLVEYALLVALIAVVCIIAIQSLGGAVSGKLSTVASAVN